MDQDSEEIPTLIPSHTTTTSQSTPTTKARTSKGPVPLTIITGFLGSGKTTLVMRFLNDPLQTRKIAVVLNEWGSSGGIDQSLKKLGTSGDEDDEWLELANGCFCCSVKDMGVKAIENLIKRSPDLDCVLLETTGLADPAPIASMFWLDKALQSELYLDGIITVTDALHLPIYLSEKKESSDGINEAIKQIAMADRIILNKIDLVSSTKELDDLEMQIKSINKSAILLKTNHANVPLDFIFDLHSFDQFSHQIDPFSSFLSPHHHQIDPSVTTVSFTTSQSPIDLPRFEKWIQWILWTPKSIPLFTPGSVLDYGDEEIPRFHPDPILVIRFKAVLDDGGDEKVIAQSVRETYDVIKAPRKWNAKVRESKLVFIGKGLHGTLLETSFLGFCLAVSPSVKATFEIHGL